MDTFALGESALQVIAHATRKNDLLPKATQEKVRALISDWEKQLSALDQKREDLGIMIELYRTAIAPHRILPTDILCEIFILCQGERKISIPWKLYEEPWNITRVCSTWREIALHIPALWSNISINRENMGLYQFSKYMRMTDELLKRSGNSPISLDADFGHGLRVSHISEVSQFLKSNAHRFKNIHLTGHNDYINPFLQIPSVIAQSLCSLSIDAGASITSISVAEHSQSLRKIEVLGRIAPNLSLLSLPLAQLTVLELPCSMLHPTTALVILSRCPLLCYCSLGLSDINMQDLPNTSTPADLIQLKDLRILTLRREDGPADYTACLNRLVLPSLSDFCVEEFAHASLWTHTSTLVITRSKCLSAINLETIISSTDLEELLGETPELLQLEISYGEMLSPTILKRMASGELVSKLFLLACAIEALDGLEPHLDMLEQRVLGTATPIDEVSFTTSEGIIPSDLSEGVGYVEEIADDGQSVEQFKP